MLKAIIITGATASGKTGLSIQLAKELNGEIISCDSMQIYKMMDIGTAKPTLSEREGIPHHMLDIIYPWEEFSVADYKKMALDAIKDVAARGKFPIIVGGTGLYVNALADNIEYAQQPEDRNIRRELEDFASAHTVEELFARLEELDPEAAKEIHPNNQKRVIRAIELSLLTGKTQKQRNAESRSVPSPVEYKVFTLDWPREQLYRRINKRVDIMMEQGLVEETRSILKACEGSKEGFLSKTAFQAIGYKELIEHFNGNISLENAIELIKQRSRNYAKRQLTWFRKPLWVNQVPYNITPGQIIDLCHWE